MRRSILPATPASSQYLRGQRGPLLGDVAADELPVLGERERDGGGRVPGEGADLDAAARADELDQEGEEGALLGRDLHAVLGIAAVSSRSRASTSGSRVPTSTTYAASSSEMPIVLLAMARL